MPAAIATVAQSINMNEIKGLCVIILYTIYFTLFLNPYTICFFPLFALFRSLFSLSAWHVFLQGTCNAVLPHIEHFLLECKRLY